MANLRLDLAFVHSIGFRRLAIAMLFILILLCGSLLWGQTSPPQYGGPQPYGVPGPQQHAPRYAPTHQVAAPGGSPAQSLPGQFPPPSTSPHLPQASPHLPQMPPELLYGPSKLAGRENVVKVEIRGNRTVPVQKILPNIRTRANRPFDEDLVGEDVRRLVRTGLFVDVRPATQKVPGGLVVIFEVFERPLIRDVKFVGNSKIKPKVLLEEIGIKVGDARDPYAINRGRTKIEELYESRGFSKVRVQVFEGNKAEDERLVYLINEGHKQKVLWTRFIGNTIAGDSRLRTQIESKPPTFYIFKGEVNREEIDKDVVRLTKYYRGLGFLKARVGRELKFVANDNWLILTFVIDEGPRYIIHKISFQGNMKSSSEELAKELKLEEGEFVNKSALVRDQARIQDKYASVGYIFADVNVDLRMHEGEGKVDLVYDIREGDRYRIGDINVEIEGDYPHTQLATVLNRLSLKPGDIFDIRELRASERRLRASGLFLVDPQKDIAPKIVFAPPEYDDMEKTEVARRPKPRQKIRGQSPDGASGDRRINLTIHGNMLPPTQRGSGVGSRESRVGRPQSHRAEQVSPPYPHAAQNRPIQHQIAPGGWNLRHGEMVVRGQNAGREVPSLSPRPQRYVSPTPYPSQGADGQSYNGQLYNGQSYGGRGGQPSTGGWAPQYPNPPAPGASVAARQPDSLYPRVAAAPDAPTPLAPGSGIFSEGSPLFGGPAYGETTPLPLTVKVNEAPTGRFMFGVGINSDAGLVGSVVIDERNFDLFRPPRSWRDIINATAWRGAGQSLRIEAVPGSQVQRYMVNFQEPYLLNTLVALGLSGYYYDRRYLEWSEGRLGGRISVGYQFGPDLSGSLAFRGAKINIHNLIDPTVPELAQMFGDNYLYGFRAQLMHDTRDSAFLATSGHLMEASFEQVVGTHVYPRGEIDIRKYFLLHERADGSGRHVVGLSGRVGITGADTPAYDHYFIGGFSTLRGFDFREASPRSSSGVLTGGEFLMLAKIQYMFPITADDKLNGVVFCDTGTVEPTIDNWSDKYRVSPGFGLRITVPAMGPAPIALDFAFPVATNPGDRTEMFSFFVGFNQ